MMSQNPSEPWNPERRWSNIVIAALAAVIFLLLSEQVRVHHAQVPRADAEVTLEGRLNDLALSAPKVIAGLNLRTWTQPIRDARQAGGWDQAILAVHAGERGELDLGQELAGAAPGPTGDGFRALWRWSYLEQGAAPDPALRAKIRQALGNGYAARILEARCLARIGGPAAQLETEAQRWARPRLATLGAATGGALLLGLAGLAFGLYLGVTPARSGPLPSFRLPGRALLIVLLGWFLCLLLSGPAIGFVLALLPFLRPVALPLAYLFHASLGLAFLCGAEGITPRHLWRRAVPGQMGRAAAAGLGFLALAFAAVMAVGLALSPLLRHAEPPQRELMEVLTHLSGPVSVTLVFLTVAVAAPVFEELLFRGFLLPWLGERLQAKIGPRFGWVLALAVTAVTFAAMHMQPWGLPTLSTLGFVLGLAYVRTGNLGTSMLVHGCWNGGVFIIMRVTAHLL